MDVSILLQLEGNAGLNSMVLAVELEIFNLIYRKNAISSESKLCFVLSFPCHQPLAARLCFARTLCRTQHILYIFLGLVFDPDKSLSHFSFSPTTSNNRVIEPKKIVNRVIDYKINA